MDPLSITASIVAVLGAGGQAARAVKKLSSLKGAPDVVLKLNNELSDLRLLILAVQDVFLTVQGNGIPLNISVSTISSLKLVNEKLLELEALYHRLNSTCKPSRSDTVNVNKSVWMAEQGSLRLLQRDLRGARLKLASVIGTLNS